MNASSRAGRHAARRGIAALLVVMTALAAVGAERRRDAEDSSTLFTAPIGTNEIARAGDLSRYRYVIVNAWNHDLIAELKAKNPQIKLLVYKDMSSSRTYHCRNGVDDAHMTTGVGYCYASARHPDWFTTDQAGHRIEWGPYPGVFQMDVGNAAYQDAWAENVLAELRRYRWDGVAIDNADLDHDHIYFPGKQMQEYPTQASYQAATRSFLARVGPKLKAEGFLVLPNIQSHPTLATPALWADWTQFTSGGIQQYWMKWGEGYEGHFGGSYWLQLQDTFELVQRQGKLFLTGTAAPADDVRSMRWGRASFLLGWNGGRAGFVGGNWHPEWTIGIGTPSGPRYQVGTAWRRDFTGGTALANISDRQTQTVSLGASYLLADGSPVNSVTLPPLSGLVLRRSGLAMAQTRARTPSPGTSPPEFQKPGP